MIKDIAKKHFKYVLERDALNPAEYFLGKNLGAEVPVLVEWDDDGFLDEYFRGLSRYGDEIWLADFPTGFMYWCEGAKYRPKKLDIMDWKAFRENIDAVANMASNMLDGGLGVVSNGDFAERVFFSPWDAPFEPDAPAVWVEKLKGSFKGWRDLKRFEPYYTFDGWGIKAWLEDTKTSDLG